MPISIQVKPVTKNVCHLTSYKKEKIFPEEALFEIKYVYSPKIPLLFRIILIIKMMLFLMLKLRRGDVLIVQPQGLALSILSNFKNAHTHLDIRTLPVNINSFKDKMDKFLYWSLSLRLFARRVSSYSFITQRLKEAVELELKDKFEQYAIWTSGVNTNLFKIIEGNSIEKEGSHHFQIFYHGHISIQRGIAELIKAMTILKQSGKGIFHLKLVGDGADLAQLKKLAEAEGVGDFVNFAGFQDYSSIPQYINQGDLCVCPLPNCTEWNVSSPLKVFEYLACGKPVVCTPIPAHLDILQNIEGIVFTKGEDGGALAQAILEACENMDELRRKSTILRKYAVDHFTWQQQANKLISHLKKYQIIMNEHEGDEYGI